VALTAGVIGSGLLVFAETGWAKALGVACLFACAVTVFLLTSATPDEG
jgi:hypothetical protein